ncbi:MAG: glycoside hydrolase family protein [Sedimentisphaeraceae bacterium JB056]
MNFENMLKKVPNNAVLTQDQWWVWGASMVRDDKGRCHLFYSRWPKETGFQSWVTHSQVAHAVSDNELGPYEYVSEALPARGKQFWDGDCTHNPTVHKFAGKYYIYYMGNRGDSVIEPDPTNLNWTHRNNQRIGVAVADDPNGPWQRFDEPVIDVSEDNDAPDSLCIANPSVTQTPDGRFLMVYKSVASKRPMPFGGPVSHMVAFADKPEGPFVKDKREVFTCEGIDFPAEDPFIWYSREDEMYYAIVKDMKGSFTGAGTSLALFCSADGIDWKAADHPLAGKLEINWENGVQKVARLERPQLWLEEGRPSVLFAAVMDLDGNTFNVHIPLCTN